MERELLLFIPGLKLPPKFADANFEEENQSLVFNKELALGRWGVELKAFPHTV